MNDKTEQAERIRNNIKQLRDGLGWNQSKLAQEAGISGAALSKIEKGEAGFLLLSYCVNWHQP